MTRIDFYLLAGKDDADHFACRLIEKAWRLGNRIYVKTRDASHAGVFDRLLWTFRDQAFVPHEIAGSGSDEVAVLIGHDVHPVSHSDLLVNLDHNLVDYFSRFNRVAEVIPDTEAPRQAARERYNFYRERGYPLHHHRI